MNDMKLEKAEEKEVLSPVSEGKPVGRALFILLSVISGVLLSLIGSQTEPGFDGGGWWNEPRNAPLLSLSILFVFSAISVFKTGSVESQEGDRGTLVCGVMTAAFLAAVWAIPVIGYGFSVLGFCLFAGLVAGFKGRQLVFVAFGLSIFMLVMFRYVLGLWFPKAQLFDLLPGLGFLGNYL